MKKAFIIIGLVLLAVLLGIPYGLAIVNASDISDAQYYGTVQITNTGTANTTGVSVNMTAVSNMLINDYGVTTAFDRVAMRNSYGEDVKFMPGYDTNPWVLWVPSILENATQNDILYSGNASLDSTKYYFPGTTGMEVVDAGALEPGNNATIAMTCILDGNTNGRVIFKQAAIDMQVVAADNLTCILYRAGPIAICTLTTSLVGWDDEVDISLVMTGGTAGLFFDDILQDSASMGSYSVDDNVSDWQFGSTTTPYILTANISVDGVPIGGWDWEYATTFDDDYGGDNDATPTFRTTSSDTDVTANLTTWQPISPAQSTISGNASWPSMLTAAPDQPEVLYTNNTSPSFPFASAINAGADASSIPRSFIWQNFAFLIVIAGGMIVFRANPSLMLKAVTMTLLIVLFAIEGINMYGMFTAIYFAMFAFGIIILSRSYGW